MFDKMQVMSNAMLPVSQSRCNTVPVAAKQNSDAKLQDVQITNLRHLGLIRLLIEAMIWVS